MFKPAALLAFIGIASLGACAPPPGESAQFAVSSGRQCFRANELYGYSHEADGMVRIRTSGDRWFEMRLNRGCPDFSWIAQIGIRPVESQWLCEGRSDELIAPSPAGLDRCYVSDIRRVAPEQASRPVSNPVGD